MLAEVRLDGERVQVLVGHFDVPAGRLVRRARQLFAYDSRAETYEREVRDMFERNFAPAGFARGRDGGGSEGGAGRSGSCYSEACRRKRFWTLIGAGSGVALAGAGAILWSSAIATHDDFLGTPQTHTTRLEELRSSGKTKALVGDILFTVGIVGAGTAAGIYFFGLPREGGEATTEAPAGTGWEWCVVPLRGGGATSVRLRF